MTWDCRECRLAGRNPGIIYAVLKGDDLRSLHSTWEGADKAAQPLEDGQGDVTIVSWSVSE